MTADGKVQLSKTVDTNEGGVKTKMLMYNKGDFKCAKKDNRPDCTVSPEVCEPEKASKASEQVRMFTLKPKFQCPKPNVRPDHAPPVSGHNIRICTHEELQQACPAPCYRPELPKGGGMKMLLLKALLFGGLVYWTYDIGLWGPSERTEELWMRMRGAVISPPVEYEDSPCVGSERNSFNLRSRYNRATITILSTVAGIPGRVAKFVGLSKCPEEKDKPCKPDNAQFSDGEGQIDKPKMTLHGHSLLGDMGDNTVF